MLKDDYESQAAFLRWFIERYDKSQIDKDQILTKVDRLWEDMMAKFDEVSAKVDANTAQATKAFGEIRAKLDELSEVQITPEELQAAVDAAKAAQSAEDTAAAEAQLDALMTKLGEQQVALQSLDDLVPDAPPPVEEPV